MTYHWNISWDLIRHIGEVVTALNRRKKLCQCPSQGCRECWKWHLYLRTGCVSVKWVDGDACFATLEEKTFCNLNIIQQENSISCHVSTVITWDKVSLEPLTCPYWMAFSSLWMHNEATYTLKIVCKTLVMGLMKGFLQWEYTTSRGGLNPQHWCMKN